MREIEISKEPIELFKLLKIEGFAASGGEAKFIIAEGNVFVNGKNETRKRKKIVSGDIIELGKEKFRFDLRNNNNEARLNNKQYDNLKG